MSYIGNQPPDIGAYDVQSFNGGGTSFTLQRSATVSSILLFIDGVRQTPTDAYTVSGVTLTTTGTTPSGTDNVTVMFMGDVVDIGAPSSDTVSTATIQDDAVTAAKLANSINTEITANTAKVTNATHTGDVTGATALTIAVDAVDIAMLSATGTADGTTFLRGDNAWAAPSGGKVLQVVGIETDTSVNFASSSWTDAGTDFDLVITPSATSSKIFLVATVGYRIGDSGASHTGGLKLMRDDTVSMTPTGAYANLRNYDYGGSGVMWQGQWSVNWLDSPATISAITYSLYGVETGGEFLINDDADITSIIAMEIGA